MIHSLSGWGVFGIALMYALEATGVPLPIEIPLWLTGQLLHQGLATYWQMVFVTWVGTALGILLTFMLARMVGKPVLAFLTTRLRMQNQVARAQGWIDRFGLAAVLFTRWINWGYALSLWLAGLSQLPPGRTLAASLANSALWACAWVLLGRSLVGALSMAGLPGWLVLVPGGLLLVTLTSWRLLKNLREKRERT